MQSARILAIAALLAGLLPAAASADRLSAPDTGLPEGFKSVQPESATQFGDEYAVFDGRLYFVADDNVHGTELWRTNGESGGTSLVADLNPGAATNSSTPHRLTVVGNRLYFNAFPGGAASSETVLYIDRSASTTVKTALAQPVGGGAPVTAAGAIVGSVNGKAVISRLQGETGNSNYAVYVLGDAGTTFTKISVGTEDIQATNVYSPAATAGGYLYYSRSNTNVSPGQGGELWRTNGSSTEAVADVNPGNAGSAPDDFVATSDRVYFTADDGTHGRELWVTNPANKADTHIVYEHHANATGTSITFPGPVANGNVLYYTPADDPVTGSEVWRTDGTTAGTRVVKDISPGTDGQSGPGIFRLGGGIGILRGSDVYGSDGTDAGTALLASTGGGGYGPNHPLSFGTSAYFVAGASPFGQALWRTDGTFAGTLPISAGGFDGTDATGGCPCAQTLAALGDKLLFFGRDVATNGTGFLKLYVLDRSQPDELRTATAPPVITAANGSLTTTNGTWSGRPTTYTYQWLRNGEPIPGEPAQRVGYLLGAADAGQRISVRVTTTGIGAPRQASADSAPFVPTAGSGRPSVTPGTGAGASQPRTLTVKKPGKLRGKPRVGRTLKLRLPTFGVSGVKLSIRWFANGKRIKRQTKAKLKLTRKLKGKRISARITVTKAGYATRTLTVGPTRRVKRG